jgi:hypothetical protein
VSCCFLYRFGAPGRPANLYSDGDNPQKQIEQILAVTPILQGQKSTEKHVIPKRQSQDQGQPVAAQQIQQPQQIQQQAPPPQQPQQPQAQQAQQVRQVQQVQQSEQPQSVHQAEGDLVDFGQNEAPQAAPAPQPQMPRLPSDLKAAQTQNGGQSQKELEQTLSATSTSQAGQGPLLDFHNDMKSSLPTQPLQRQDTNDDEDEFVDAHE